MMMPRRQVCHVNYHLYVVIVAYANAPISQQTRAFLVHQSLLHRLYLHDDKGRGAQLASMRNVMWIQQRAIQSHVEQPILVGLSDALSAPKGQSRSGAATSPRRWAAIAWHRLFLSMLAGRFNAKRFILVSFQLRSAAPVAALAAGLRCDQGTSLTRTPGAMVR